MIRDEDVAEQAGEPICVDAESGATDWAHAFATEDSDTEALPFKTPPPGTVPEARQVRASATDTTTGATPGVASACRDLGLQSAERVARERGIKPPGFS